MFYSWIWAQNKPKSSQSSTFLLRCSSSVCKLPCWKQAPCLRSPPPPAAGSASLQPAFQERGARSSSHPLPGRLPHTTLPARPTRLSAGSGTSWFTQSFPFSAAWSQWTLWGAVLHGPIQQQRQGFSHLKLQLNYKKNPNIWMQTILNNYFSNCKNICPAPAGTTSRLLLFLLT